MADDVLDSNTMKLLGLTGTASLSKRYQEAMGESAGAMKRVREATAAREKALAPIETEIKGARKKAPIEPKLDELPGEFKHQGMSNEEMRDNMQMMFALAAIGGAMTRRPVTAAITAFNGAMTGMLQGDKITFEREAKTYDENMKRAIARNNSAVEEYQLAAEKHRNDIQGLMNEWKLIATKYGDTVSNALLEANNASEMMKHIESLVAMNNKAEAAADNMERQMKLLQLRLDKDEELRIAREANAKRRDTNADFAQEDKLRMEYAKEIAPVKNLKMHIDSARAAVASGTPFDTRQAQALLTQISKGSRATNLQIAMNKNWGNLGERMGRFANLFVSGNWSDQQKKEVNGFLDALEDAVTKPYIEAETKRAEKLAKAYGLNPKRVTMMDDPYAVGEPPVSDTGDETFNASAFLDRFNITP